MDLKETIKQQGTQASALLPELQEYVDSKVEELRGGEYIVEFSIEEIKELSEESTVTGLKGYQNILAVWDKLLKGEIQPDKVRAVLKYKYAVYTSTGIFVRADAEEKSFYANFIAADWTVRTSENFKHYFGELRIYKFVDTSPNINSTSVEIRTCGGESHRYNAEFTD